MAVAVPRTPQMVLDAEYRIVEIGRDVEAGFGELVGLSLWEAYPGSEPLFRPYYEKARQTGEQVEFVQFFNGYLTRVQAVPDKRRLLLFWEVLCRLDTLTLDGLRSSLARAVAIIEECKDRAGRDQMRRLLHVVEGNGS